MPAYYQRIKNFFGLNEDIDDSSKPHSINSAATTNANQVKTAPGVVTFIVAMNVSAAPKFLKFYDTNKAPVAGSGIPVARIPIPTVATTGAGVVISMPVPLRFLAGIAYTITGLAADSDTTVLAANDVTLTLGYI